MTLRNRPLCPSYRNGVHVWCCWEKWISAPFANCRGSRRGALVAGPGLWASHGAPGLGGAPSGHSESHGSWPACLLQEQSGQPPEMGVRAPTRTGRWRWASLLPCHPRCGPVWAGVGPALSAPRGEGVPKLSGRPTWGAGGGEGVGRLGLEGEEAAGFTRSSGLCTSHRGNLTRWGNLIWPSAMQFFTVDTCMCRQTQQVPRERSLRATL